MFFPTFLLFLNGKKVPFEPKGDLIGVACCGVKFREEFAR